ncbi:hypothetical protein ScPMuIL_011064 [Solemya velum]
MERATIFNKTMHRSMSLPSLAEGSEPISEAEELNEMKSLQERGHKAMKIHNYDEALRLYNEALEIDDQNVGVLVARANAYMVMEDFINAQKDAESLIAIQHDKPQGYKIQGRALKNLNQYKDSLLSYLMALTFEPENIDELTNQIISVVSCICEIPQDLKNTLEEMDPYKKLSEIGVCLYHAKKHKLCIKMLEAAQQFQTNQKGITMRLLLTLANAHSSVRVRHQDRAIALYQECLTVAMATHDQMYQTKALVNIATLYLECKDTFQAIIYYEKLLQLQSEILEEVGDEDCFPEFWSKELQCGLHLNLSIAYKSIGNMHSALKHARQYVTYVEKHHLQGKIQAESYHNTGMLNEILNNFKEAVENYSQYLKCCQKNGDRKGIAQAYGCLGSVYASLNNWTLSITYHEQYVKMASKFDDKKMLVIANEILGNTYMLKEDYDQASCYYEAMLNSCIRTDYRTRATGLSKIGNAYKAMKKYQYSLYFYQQACDLAEDFEYDDIKTICLYNIACIHKQSTQMLEMEKAQKYFETLIPFLETKIKEHKREDIFCPKEYYSQLSECYNGIQTVLSKLGNKEECLQYAEMSRKQSNGDVEEANMLSLANYGLEDSSVVSSVAGHSLWRDVCDLEKVNRIVSQQNATLLYYSVLQDSLLLWVLQPGQGITRFYHGKCADGNMVGKIKQHLTIMKRDIDWKKMQTEIESRALPYRESELEYTKRQYSRLQKTSHHEATPESSPEKEEPPSMPLKPPQRELYNLLLAPVEDILSKLDSQSQLTIVPDKVLYDCPFGVLQDWMLRYMADRFHITYLPSLKMLEKVVNNEYDWLKSQDELQFERNQSKKGALSKFLTQAIIQNCPTSVSDRGISISSEAVDLKRVSNPRLITAGRVGLELDVHKPSSVYSRWSPPPLPQSRLPTRSSSPGSPGTPRMISNQGTISARQGNSALSPRLNPHVPVSTDKMLGTHTYSTLSTKTATETDITSSSLVITSFTQISSFEKCLVYGSPYLPECLMLHNQPWKPGCEILSQAKQEVFSVASILDTEPVYSHDATRENFLKDICQPSIIHIVTFGCWEEGLLVMSPNPIQVGEGPPQEQTYLVTADDIASLKLCAQLVVLNMGYTPYRKDSTLCGYKLPSAFLSAGAQAVLVCLSPLPDAVMEKFYYHFYTSLKKESLLTVALRQAMKAIREDKKYSHIFYWSPFILIGKDVEVNLKHVRKAMLHQSIDLAEMSVGEETGKEYLNPKSIVPHVETREENLYSLQKVLSHLLRYHTLHPDVLVELIDLLDGALKRLHTKENIHHTVVLPQIVMQSVSSLDLLKLLGFHFQAKGTSLSDPYVLFPHWNKDDLLVPSYDALKAIQAISDHPVCTQALCDLLPATQDNISLLVDLLCITKHAAEVQLKITDLSVHPLWHNSKIQKMLIAAGFHQIGTLLNRPSILLFNKTPSYRQLLTALLQLLLSVSSHKSQVLQYRLDVELLGKPGSTKSSAIPDDEAKLTSLTPLILPRNQLRMCTPWLTSVEKPLEMREKLSLAHSKSDIDERYRNELKQAKTWHQLSTVAQANEAMSEFGRPKTMPNKMKMLPGRTASQNRTPVNQKKVLVIPEIDQRRDYAHFVMQERLGNVSSRHREDLIKLYLPYVNSQ